VGIIEEMKIACPLCAVNSHVKYLCRLYDDRYGYPDFFTVYYCRNCNHRFIDKQELKSVSPDLYSQYYPRKEIVLSDVKAPVLHKGLKGWIKGEKRSAFSWVPENVRVLDIGCGNGATLFYHKERGCDAYGTELDKNVKVIADHFKLNIKFGNFCSVDYPEKYFDYITMDQVIEHISNPELILKEVYKALKDDGFLILSTPNPGGAGLKIFRKKWIHWHVPYHVQYFSFKSLKLLLDKCSLEIVTKKCITPSAWLYWQIIHCVCFPQKSYPSYFWNNPGENHSVSFINLFMIRIVKILYRSSLFHIITRALDLPGIGDNSIYFIRKSK
jgi:2-polyprenyl-3-methyl-5-hydroxy-6-metoxy-1,4-benzoquinol methylase